MPERVSRRTFLQATVASVAGVAGCYAKDEPDPGMIGGGGGGGEVPLEDKDSSFVIFSADEDPDAYTPPDGIEWALHPDEGLMHWGGS